MSGVSVIVPTYNGAAFVRETLESVLAQSLPPLELLVCDDGSTDATLDIVNEIAQRSSAFPVRVLRQANRGVAAARNRAVSEARGELLAFLDHDDTWEPELLEVLVPRLREHPEWGLVYADSWVIDGAGTRFGKRGQWLRYAQGDVFEALLAGNFIPVETTLVRADFFRSLGGYDERLRFLEDYELCLRIARRAPIGFVDRALASYRVHERNLSHDLEGMLAEWLEMLARFEPQGLLRTDAERAQVAREKTRLAADIAWRALRRNDRRAAAQWLARSVGPGHAWRRVKVRLLAALLAALPRAAGDALLARLPRRRLYGIIARPDGALAIAPREAAELEAARR